MAPWLGALLGARASRAQSMLCFSLDCGDGFSPFSFVLI